MRVSALIAALLLVVGVGGRAHADGPPDHLSVVRDAFAGWAAGRGSVFDLLADDVRWEILGDTPVSGVYPSRADFQRRVLDPFTARMAGPLRPSLRRLDAVAGPSPGTDTVIALFDAEGTARDGAPYHNTYTWYLDMRAGRIVAAQALLDTQAFNDLWRRIPV